MYGLNADSPNNVRAIEYSGVRFSVINWTIMAFLALALEISCYSPKIKPRLSHPYTCAYIVGCRGVCAVRRSRGFVPWYPQGWCGCKSLCPLFGYSLICLRSHVSEIEAGMQANVDQKLKERKIHLPAVGFEPPTLGTPGDDGNHYTTALPLWRFSCVWFGVFTEGCES